jgi:type IV pilus assembly protein PilQ
LDFILSNQLIIKDIPANLPQLRELIRYMDRETPQVLIEARVVEASTNWASNNGSFSLGLNNLNGYAYSSRGTGGTSATTTSFTAPITNVVTGLSKIATPSVLLRVNGTQVGSSASTQGLGNYGTHAVYIGRRGGSTLPLNGLIYQLIFRNKLTTGSLCAAAEREVARKSGVSI